MASAAESYKRQLRDAELSEAAKLNDFAIPEKFNYYPSIDDKEFYQKLFEKTELSFTPNTRREKTSKRLYQLQPHQIFVKNFLSPFTPYNGLLLFYGTGSGKTCAALTVAEQFREQLVGTGGKIIVLGRSSEHVKGIFMREMYDLSKELDEIKNGLPEGSTSCLGNLYYTPGETKFIDEYSFSVNRKKNEQKIESLYEFYGFTQFHKLIKKIETNQEFIEDYFKNCLFIIDEAHNLSGLELETDNANKNEIGSPSNLTLDGDRTPNLASTYDESAFLNAEKLRIKIISLKRQESVNNLKIVNLIETAYYDQTSQRKINQLNRENEYLKSEISKLMLNLFNNALQELTSDRDSDEKLSLDDADLLVEHYQANRSFSMLESDDELEEIFATALDKSKILVFLSAVENDSCLKNHFSSFLKIIDIADDAGDDSATKRSDGLKAYQALKKTLIAVGGSKVILLTATPMRDRPESIVNLINILRVNDGHSEINITEIFKDDTEGSVDIDKLSEIAMGYVSYYRGDDVNFPQVIWNLDDHPNAKDRALIKLVPQSPIYLNPTEENSPVTYVLECRSDPDSIQELEYLRYLRYQLREQELHRQDRLDRAAAAASAEDKRGVGASISNLSKTQLEYRCNFGFLLEAEKLDDDFLSKFEKDKKLKLKYFVDEDDVDDDGNPIKYLMNYTKSTIFDLLFTYEAGGMPGTISNVSYRKGRADGASSAADDEDIYGDFLHESNIGKYSVKLNILLQMLQAAQGGIHLIYSQYSYLGCYLIALTLERFGFRKYPNQSLWRDSDENPRRCAICFETFERHDKSGSGSGSGTGASASTTKKALGHDFQQAQYVIAVGSSEDVTRNMNTLRSPENRYGNKIKVVIGTSTITEGLDFKFIRYIHVFDPWYNYTRLDQLAGRGSRQGSHDGYPSSEYRWDNVTMFLYCYFLSQTQLQIKDDTRSESESDIEIDVEVDKRARGKNKGKGKGNYRSEKGFSEKDNTSDQKLTKCFRYQYKPKQLLTRDINNYLISLYKDCQIKKIEKILRDVSVDCPLYLPNNLRSIDNDYSRQCFYNKCGYNCLYLPQSITIEQDEESGGYLATVSNTSNRVKPNSSFKIDNKTTVEEILKQFEIKKSGYNLIGFYSGLYYDSKTSFIQQLTSFGDNRETRQTVAWIIGPKDYSTFLPYTFENNSHHIIKLIKFIITDDLTKNGHIFSLEDVVTQVKKYITFNLPPQFNELLVKHALTQLSGVFVNPTVAFTNGSLISMELSGKTYYVFHPKEVKDLDTSIYYKYVYPEQLKMSQSKTTSIKYEKIVSKKKTDAQIIHIFKQFSEYLTNEPHNMFYLYSEFLKQELDMQKELLYQLIVN